MKKEPWDELTNTEYKTAEIKQEQNKYSPCYSSKSFTKIKLQIKADNTEEIKHEQKDSFSGNPSLTLTDPSIKQESTDAFIPYLAITNPKPDPIKKRNFERADRL